MKKLISGILFPCFVLIIIATSCNSKKVTDKDYDEITGDVCDCVNEEVNKLSPIMKKILTDPNMSAETFQLEMQGYLTQHPDESLAIMKDIKQMKNLGAGIPDCVKKLEGKYANLYSFESKTQVENKIMDKLKTNSKCSLLNNLLNMAEMQNLK